MKKLLALVLALVMTLSLATVSSNAAFKDAKDINETYAEAAEVLAGMGVFKGYEEKDGTFSFNPKGDITRAEVAAIIYRIYTADVAKNDKSGLYATYNKFSDMAGAGWAAGYIGYCANAEFVKGYPDGTFKPLGKVTGYEVLAMILRAVGYDKLGEFTGAGWQLHVAQIAEQNKILKNVKGVDLNAAASRELVAEMLFRAIAVAPMVTYTSAFGYQTVSFDTKKDNKLFKENETLGHKNFGLASTSDTNDKWGRPVKTWFDDSKTKDGKYNASVSTVYAKIVATPDAAYHVATSECDICKDLNVSKKATVAERYDNGTANLKYNKEIVATATKATLGAQGQQIEFYELDSGDYRMVVIDTYLAYVNEVVTEKLDAKGHVVRDAYVVLDGFTTKDAKTTDSKDIETLYVKGNDYAEGDWLLVNVNEVDKTSIVLTSNKKASSVKTVEVVDKATSFEGAQTDIWTKAYKHTIDKKDYMDATTFYLNEAGTDGTANYTWFVDQFGNLIGAAGVDNSNYAVLKDIYWSLGKPGYADATIVYMDGKEESVKVSSIDGIDYETSDKNAKGEVTELCGDFDPKHDDAVPTLSDSENSNKFVNKKAYMSSDTTYTGNYDGLALYKVVTNKDGTVALQAIDTDKQGSEIAANRAVYYAENATINAKGTTLTGKDSAGNSVRLPLSDNTKFIVRETEDGKYVYKDYTLKDLNNYADGSLVVYYTIGANNFVNRVYIKHAAAAATMGSYIFMPEADDSNIHYSTADKVVYVNVYVDGELQQVEANKAIAATLMKNEGKLFKATFNSSYTANPASYGSLASIELVNEYNDNKYDDAFDARGYKADYITGFSFEDKVGNVVASYTDYSCKTLENSTRLDEATIVKYDAKKDETKVITAADLTKADFEENGVWVVTKDTGREGVAQFIYVGTPLKKEATLVASYKTTADDNSKDLVFVKKGDKFVAEVNTLAPGEKAVSFIYAADYENDYVVTPSDGKWLTEQSAGVEEIAGAGKTHYQVGKYSVEAQTAKATGIDHLVYVTAEDGVSKYTYEIKVNNGRALSDNVALDNVTIDGSDIDINEGAATVDTAEVGYLGQYTKFVMNVEKHDSKATLKIGSGSSIENAVKNLQVRDSVEVTASTALNGGYIVIEVTAENKVDKAYYVYDTEAAPVVPTYDITLTAQYPDASVIVPENGQANIPAGATISVTLKKSAGTLNADMYNVSVEGWKVTNVTVNKADGLISFQLTAPDELSADANLTVNYSGVN